MLKTVLSEKMGGGKIDYSAPECEVLNLDTDTAICQGSGAGTFGLDDWNTDDLGLDF